MKKAHLKPPCHERGIVLVIVLWIVALLSIMAGSFAYSMRVETLLAAHTLEHAQAKAMVEAGVAYATLYLLSAKDSQQWPADGSEREWSFGPGYSRIQVFDAAGRIDLNRSHRDLLRGLLLAAGVADDQVERLLDAIEDWRDPDDLRRSNGAEMKDYVAAGRTLGPKNAPFEAVEELQQVLGMTPELYRRIESAVTVYSKQPGIDPATASKIVLQAVPGIDPNVIDEYIRLRAEHLAQGLPPPPLPGGGPYLSRSGGLAYHVRVEAHPGTGIALSAEAVVIKANGDPQHRLPYRLVAWREGK